MLELCNLLRCQAWATGDSWGKSSQQWASLKGTVRVQWGQALDEYLTWRASVDRRKISMTIRAKSDGEVTQGLMERWSSGDGGYGVSLYCKAKVLQTCHNGLYTGALLSYNKESIIEGIEGWEGNTEKMCWWLCHMQIGDVIKWKRRKEKKQHAVTDCGKYCDWAS